MTQNEYSPKNRFFVCTKINIFMSTHLLELNNIFIKQLIFDVSNFLLLSLLLHSVFFIFVDFYFVYSIIILSK